ncbi:unnamed protein product [Cuscuta epithymum]|uniref:glutathione transferase n=1 Tax=Cuscuta epithymum TaxID=186058 RepID=A0AAV0E8B4_9ASTE|nr:unnamed protein product [Cuscuta epithymum]CAH9140520.1 unnamed protein product [Cuscuta epithymum]
MALKVHGSLASSATLRVIGCLEEKGLKYEFVRVNLQAGEHKKEPFLRLNPFGQVPAFEDGDLTLFESRAITQYIAHTYANRGSQLIPSDNKTMDTMSLWMEIEANHFDEVGSKLYHELTIKPMRGMVADKAAVAQHEEALVKILDVYEERLKVSKFLAGNCFTLVDLHHTPLIYHLMHTKVKVLFEARSNVAAWVDYLFTRPAWLKVLQLIIKHNNAAFAS